MATGDGGVHTVKGGLGTKGRSQADQRTGSLQNRKGYQGRVEASLRPWTWRCRTTKEKLGSGFGTSPYRG